MEEEILLDDFFIEIIEEIDSVMVNDKIYFNPEQDEVYFEEWHS